MRVATNKLLLCSFLLLGLAACQKDPEPVPETPPPAKTVTKVGWSDQDFVTYEYNAAGLVTRHVSQWANGTGTVNKLTNTYTYSDNGQLTRWQNEAGYSTFVYKGNKPESSAYFFTNGRQLSSMKYQFDNNRLVSVIERNEMPLPDDAIETKVSYTYYPNGNVQRIDFAYRNKLTDPFVINFSKVIDLYDNKPNPEPDGVLGTILPGVVLHKNNPVKISTLLPNNTVEGFSRFEYTYNAQGLPQQRKQYITTGSVEQLPTASTFQY
jgi:YD repeat-containing protein